MKTSVKNSSLPSKIKLAAISAGQRIYNSVSSGSHGSGSWSSWNVQSIPNPADSERCVEVPWVASAISNCAGLWLDIGHAHAEDRYWHAIRLDHWKRFLRYGYGLDIAPARGVNPLPVHIIADLIEEPLDALPDFNLITCISTLEHIGCDNQLYLESAKRMSNPQEIQRNVLSKLLSKLSRTGRLFVSVPFGKYQDNGWFLQYDSAMAAKLKETARQSDRRCVSEKYYMLTKDGWRSADPVEMKEIVYHPEEKRAAGVALLEFA